MPPLLGYFLKNAYFQLRCDLGAEHTQPKQIRGESKTRRLERSAHSGYKNAHRLWDDAHVQVGGGWVGGAILITSSGLLPDIHPGGVNISPASALGSWVYYEMATTSNAIGPT